MWRWILAVLIAAATFALALLLRSLLHDETAASAIAGMLGVFGIALLWPVEFGLKERPPS